MLMDLTRPLKEGDTIPITLTVVDNAGKTQKIEVRASVRALTATAPQSRGTLTGLLHGTTARV